MNAVKTHKYQIGQTVYRFGTKAKIVSRDLSPLGFLIYQIEEIYRGNLETTQAQEDELSTKP